MPVDPLPGAPDLLQGYELVAHVFVAADGSAADHRYFADLWQRCVETFALDAVVDPYPGRLPTAAAVVDEGDDLLAVRSRDGGVHQMAARRVHDVLCLSLVLAPARAAGWTELDVRWQQLQQPPTPGVLGSVRIMQARLAEHGAELDVVALAPVVAQRSGTPPDRWRPGTLRAEPPLGPFAVWEAGDPTVDQQERDGRPDRHLAVLAPAERDPELSAGRGAAVTAP